MNERLNIAISGVVDLSRFEPLKILEVIKQIEQNLQRNSKYYSQFHFRNIFNTPNKTIQTNIDSLELLDSNKIKINTIRTSEGIYLQGEGLKYDSLMNYSPKYCKLLDLIFNAGES